MKQGPSGLRAAPPLRACQSPEKIFESILFEPDELCGLAIIEVKKLIDKCEKMDVENYKEHTVEKISELRISEEGQEGIKAFLEKRKPKWGD